MSHVARNPGDAQAWGAAARARVEKDFATALICEQHLRLYGEIVALDSRL